MPWLRAAALSQSALRAELARRGLDGHGDLCAAGPCTRAGIGDGGGGGNDGDGEEV